MFVVCVPRARPCSRHAGFGAETDDLRPQQVRRGAWMPPRPDAQVQPEQSGGEICPVLDTQASQTPPYPDSHKLARAAISTST